MAASRAKSQPIGSTEWIRNEHDQTAELVQQDVDDFEFMVRNELDWLNAHMSQIFSQDQVNFTDIFKTPGKLRGKTPRTARKRDILAPREPLSDIFAPNIAAPPSAHKTAFLGKVSQFQIVEDAENQPPSARPASRSKSPQRIGKPGNADSGYHGMMTEDEMEMDNRTEVATLSSQQSMSQSVPVREIQVPVQRLPDVIAETGDISNDSFASAKEDVTSRMTQREQLSERNAEGTSTADFAHPVEATDGDVHSRPASNNAMDYEQEPEDEIERSNVSSPEKPLNRKSSFTFTSLPARDTLTAKRSIGFRNSQIDHAATRESVLGRLTGAKIASGEPQQETGYTQEPSAETKAHNKTSTQLLHERINMLGKTKEARTSKSIPQPLYPQLSSVAITGNEGDDEVSDGDDWIAPSKPSEQAAPKTAFPTRAASPERPMPPQKSVSATQIPSPTKASQKAISVSNPSFAQATAQLSTTPAGSPMTKRLHDGPLSASKNKIYSVLKSARSIFASSGTTSAAAKLEAHNTSPSRSPQRIASDESKTAAVFNMPGALYSDRQLPQSPSRPISIISSPSKKGRNSNESDRKREKELKAQQKAAEDLEKAREKERLRAAKQQGPKMPIETATVPQPTERPATASSEDMKAEDMPPPPPPKNTIATGKLRAPGRLVKPTREALKPAPVAIRVASQSQRLGQNLTKSQHEASTGPPMPPKQNQTRPGSAQGSVRSSTAPNNARVKALEAAARKKEADDRAALEKAEKKRELERKRAAKVEEDRRIEEERRAAEQVRLQEAKLVAQRQAEKHAADARKREMQRHEQMRQQEEAQKAKAAHELAEAIKRERAQQAQTTMQHPRGDVGSTIRQLTKSTVPEASAPSIVKPVIQPNQAKPAKRNWEVEEDDEQPRPTAPPQMQRPGMPKGQPSYQQLDAKRRRTNEEDVAGPERHSVMAPPKRPSNMPRKESIISKLLPTGYTQAPQPVLASNHHATTMYKAAVTAQHQLQHSNDHKPTLLPAHPSQTVQVSNAKIPFAVNANPPTNTQYQNHQQTHGGFENMHPNAAQQQSKFKTPARQLQQVLSTAAKSTAKSSPLFLNGDNIHLPEIATDSEDEDSDEEENTGFRAPSWVASPALRELLTQQQLVDPETVFGPIGELRMDEVFKGGKNPDRLKRLRDRGSSAAWVESGDAVTSAEKRRDMELRERVVREGGWRFEPNV